MTIDDGTIRTFESGATRDTAEDKLDYEGFLNPMMLRRFAEYMHSHRRQSDGSMRDSDNWQKGIPIPVYLKSLIRHVVELWTEHRLTGDTYFMEEVLCAIIFNANGMLTEVLKKNSAEVEEPVWEYGNDEGFAQSADAITAAIYDEQMDRGRPMFGSSLSRHFTQEDFSKQSDPGDEQPSETLRKEVQEERRRAQERDGI